MFGTRVYALVLVLSLATVVAVEVVPREKGRLSDDALGKRQDKFAKTLHDMVERVGRGEVELEDDLRLAGVKKEIELLESEARVREVRTGAFVFLALASALFALVTAPGVLLRSRAPPRAGTLELEPDETVEIDATDAHHEIGRLHESKKKAVTHLLSQVSLHCASCRWLWRPDVLGRVGRRILLRRMPPGSGVEGDVLGEGWWSRPSNPPSSCPKCGGRDMVPD